MKAIGLGGVCAAALTLASSAFAQGPADQGRYIVVLQPGAGAPGAVAADVARSTRGRVGHVYRNALNGFSLHLPEAAVKNMRADKRIAFIERDLPMSIVAQTTPTGIDRSFASGNAGIDIDATDDFRVDVDIAILDTGIDYEHPDLNVVGGIDCTFSTGGIFGTRYCEPTANGDDDQYHGTHVAGTAAALDNGIGVVGVAPGARLWAVKVLDSGGSGYTSGIIAGIDWVVAQGDIEVLNMSLGGSGVSSAYQTAIDNAVASGVVVVVAAGNANTDANNYSPAYVPSAITVSALADFDGLEGGFGSPTCRSDQDDTLADFSNWGSAVDIAAPGVCTLSTFPIEQGEYATISGTSMAAPHVAGAAGLLASGANAPSNGADVQTIRNRLVADGNLNWIDDSGDGIHEPLLDVSTITPVLVATGGAGGTNQAPVADFSFSCTDLSCSFTDASTDDAGVTGYSWDFGDGAGSSTAQNPSYSFGTGGTYSVTLTVTDAEGLTGTSTQDVSVTDGSTGGGSFSLTTAAYKQRGRLTVDLSWSGSSASSVDVYRDGGLIETTANDGAYTDATGQRGGATFVYQVCEAGTATCTNQSTVNF